MNTRAARKPEVSCTRPAELGRAGPRFPTASTGRPLRSGDELVSCSSGASAAAKLLQAARRRSKGGRRSAVGATRRAQGRPDPPPRQPLFQAEAQALLQLLAGLRTPERDPCRPPPAGGRSIWRRGGARAARVGGLSRQLERRSAEAVPPLLQCSRVAARSQPPRKLSPALR